MGPFSVAQRNAVGPAIKCGAAETVDAGDRVPDSTPDERQAIGAYAGRSGAPSESAAIRDLLALSLAAAVDAEVRASVGEGIASPKPRPRDPA